MSVLLYYLRSAIIKCLPLHQIDHDQRTGLLRLEVYLDEWISCVWHGMRKTEIEKEK